MLSYGGTLSLRQKFSSDVYDKSERGTDVVLDGGDISIFWTNPNQFPSGVSYVSFVPTSTSWPVKQGTTFKLAKFANTAVVYRVKIS